jgi:hypothetical protein
MTASSFGQVIPVLGPNIGFPGAVSRFGDRVILARELNPSATLNLNFGDPAVIIPNATGGYYDSVLDFVTALASNIGLVAGYFAGMAVREVKTMLTYNTGNPAILSVGYYAPNSMAEVLERGSGTVFLSVGAPNTQAQLYTRVVLNSAVTAGTIGDWETNPAATDLFSTTGTAAAIGTALTLASATNTKNGQVVTGLGIAPGTYIVSGGGTTSAVLNQNTTAIIAAGTPVTISNLVALADVVARTGYVDANGMLEITIKNRHAA